MITIVDKATQAVFQTNYAWYHGTPMEFATVGEARAFARRTFAKSGRILSDHEVDQKFEFCAKGSR